MVTAMPFAPANSTAIHQAAAVKPCVSPYQGTAIKAIAAVSTNMRVVAQTRGGFGSRLAVWFMRVRRTRSAGHLRGGGEIFTPAPDTGGFGRLWSAAHDGRRSGGDPRTNSKPPGQAES